MTRAALDRFKWPSESEVERPVGRQKE